MIRWPIIRHFRYFVLARRVEQHYRVWAKVGFLPVYRDNDQRVLDAIWRGEL